MVEVSLTVGKLDASLALLLTQDHHLIEFPTILLPNGVKAGSIVKIKCEQDFDTEQQEAKQFQSIQDEILDTFGKNLPVNPILKVKNVTQTSCVLEWEDLNLGTATLKNLFLYKGGKKLGAIPQPLTNRTTKLSGLPIDQTFEFQLKLDTTAGVYTSDILEVTTHKMTDLSGITVCLGDISPNEAFTIDDIEDTLKNMGAHYPAQTKVSVDTTHFICTRENKQNQEFIKANEMNIPIIRPEWLKACERDRRIVGVRDYYVKDCVLPDIFAKNFWNKAPAENSRTKDDTLPEIPAEAAEGTPEIKKDTATEPEIQVTEATPESEKPEEEDVKEIEEEKEEKEAEKEDAPVDTEEIKETVPEAEPEVATEAEETKEAEEDKEVVPENEVAESVENGVIESTETEEVKESKESEDIKTEAIEPTEAIVEPAESKQSEAEPIADEPVAPQEQETNGDASDDKEDEANESKTSTKSKNKKKKNKNKKK